MNECAVGRQKILATLLFIGFSLPPFTIWISGPNWEPVRRLWSMAWDISAWLQWSVLSAFCLSLPLTDSLLFCWPYYPLSIPQRDIEADELGFATELAALVLWGKNTNESGWWRRVGGEVRGNALFVMRFECTSKGLQGRNKSGHCRALTNTRPHCSLS